MPKSRPFPSQGKKATHSRSQRSLWGLPALPPRAAPSSSGKASPASLPWALREAAEVLNVRTSSPLNGLNSLRCEEFGCECHKRAAFLDEEFALAHASSSSSARLHLAAVYGHHSELDSPLQGGAGTDLHHQVDGCSRKPICWGFPGSEHIVSGMSRLPRCPASSWTGCWGAIHLTPLCQPCHLPICL